MEENKKQNKLLAVWIVCFAIIAGAIALLLYSIFNQQETRTSTTREDVEMGVLECKSGQPKDAFFHPEGEMSPTHKLKIVMKAEKPSEVAYEYVGTFGDEASARTASAVMNADYGLTLGAEADKLSPVFSVIDTTARVSLYASAGKLNSVNAQVFFLTTDEMLEFYNLSKETIKKIYADKNFTCEYIVSGN